MYDMGFRDYNPSLNRFLTLDAYNGALADLGLGLDPWTNNRYAFTGGNPITGIELDGHIPDDWANGKNGGYLGWERDKARRVRGDRPVGINETVLDGERIVAPDSKSLRDAFVEASRGIGCMIPDGDMMCANNALKIIAAEEKMRERLCAAHPTWCRGQADPTLDEAIVSLRIGLGAVIVAGLARNSKGRLIDPATGRFVADPSRPLSVRNSIHGNSRGNANVTVLNTLHDLATDEYLKVGISSAPSAKLPGARYTSREMQGKYMIIRATFPNRLEALAMERFIEEIYPGPLNKKSWAGSRRSWWNGRIPPWRAFWR